MSLWSLFFSLQVVVAPILLGSYLESTFPAAVNTAIPFAPLFAVLASSLLACRFSYLCIFDLLNLFNSFQMLCLCLSLSYTLFYSGTSIFSENVIRLKASMASVSLTSDLSILQCTQTILSGELGAVILSVLLLHFAGFFVG